MGNPRDAKTLITPLNQCSPGGERYERTRAVVSKLSELLSIPSADLIARCEVRDQNDPHYVPSECVLYFVRNARAQPEGERFAKLYKVLVERVLQRLPRGETKQGAKLADEKVRDAVRDRFVEMLAGDRETYDERLDFFEIRFDMALRRARLSALKSVRREGGNVEPLTYDEHEELSADVQAAAATFDLPDVNVEAEECRLTLDAAIDALEPDERRTIHMLRQGFPIDSSDPGQVTIRKTLGRSEKGIRNIRDRAFVKLRAALAAKGYS
jgi:DNA-directed RNA polymerase specialized sigma24 family protein